MKLNDFEINVYTREPVAALQRIMALFSRNRIFLKHVLLKEEDKINQYKIKLIIVSNEESIQKIFKKMEKIIELLQVRLQPSLRGPRARSAKRAVAIQENLN